MNIIIVGGGKVGAKLAETLNLEKDNNITIVDSRFDVVKEISDQHDVMGVVGNVMDVATMQEAGIEDADILIAVTGSDEINMLSCVMAKKLSSCKTIARVRKPEYSRAVHLIKDELSLAMVINPELAAANTIARILRMPSAVQVDTFAKGRIEILTFRVEKGSPLDNIKVQDIVSKLGCDVLVCGIERDNETFIPRGNFTINHDDIVSVVVPIVSEAAFFKKIAIKNNRVKNTMIVGGGGISYYLAEKMCEAGIAVKIIEKNSEKCDILCQLLPKATIINGDGTEKRLLLEEGIEQAESFVSLTNMDEENILLSLYAKSTSDAKVITKINRIAYDDVVNRLNIGTPIYPKNITAENIIRFIRAKKNSIGNNIETMHFILNNKAEALEFRIGENSPISDVPIEKINLKDNVLIASINRGGKAMIPRGGDIIRKGDTVIIVTLRCGCNDIGDLLK